MFLKEVENFFYVTVYILHAYNFHLYPSCCFDSPVEEYLGEAERALRGESGGEGTLVLADVHLWIYIVQHERFCKQVRYLSS